MTDQTFGKYVVIKQLGSGGMADVYLGHDPMLDRDVAIKVIHPALVHQEGFEDRFRREAKVVASLRHPNIVQVYDFDIYNGAPSMIMEFLDGGSLKYRLADYRSQGHSMPLEEALTRLTALASGLDYAHERGLVHRDLKPANVLFTKRGEPVITDFGIAKILDETTQMTTQGELLGTPAYMSPEQATGKHVDKRSDIYSLGVVVFEMVTGRVPFVGESTTAIMMQHLTQSPPPPRQFNPELPDSIQTVILKALAKNPDDRYLSAGEFAQAFSTALHTPASSTVSPDQPTVIDPDGATVIEQPAQNRPEETPPGPPRDLPEHTHPATFVTAAPASIAPVVPSPRARPRANKRGLPLVALGVGLIALVLLVAGVLFGYSRLGFGSPAAPVGQANGSVPNSSSGGMTGMGNMDMSQGAPPSQPGDSVGILRFSDGSAHADQATLNLTNIPRPAAGTRYEAWLVGNSGESRVSLGKVDVDSKGNAQLTYVDKDGQNLLGLYDRFELTIEPDPDPSPLPSGNVAFSSAVPPGSMMHIGHLLVAFDDTPNHTGFVVGLLEDGNIVNQTTLNMLAADQNKDFEQVLIDAETLVNVIEGKQGENYGDLDKNGVITDPSDGYGLLLNGKNSGYIEGAIDHAGLAAQSPDATAEIKMHSEHVKIAAKNVEDWATQLRDQCLQILSAKDLAAAEGPIRQSVALGNKILKGIDINGNETIDPIPGEAGAEMAYEHAFYMADMPILRGPNAMPTPGK